MFLKNNGVRHITPPYHPASNEAAERAVQTFKKAWTRLKVQSVPIHQRLPRFLFTYRNTPHTVTECTPAELFLKRQPRTRLKLLKPDLSRTMAKHQLQQKKAHGRHSKTVRELKEEERVMVRDFRHPKRLWNLGVILQQVQIGHHQVNVHVDHLLRSNAPAETCRENKNNRSEEHTSELQSL